MSLAEERVSKDGERTHHHLIELEEKKRNVMQLGDQWLTARHPCFYCGGIGHWSPNCPIKAKAEQVGSKRENQSSIASIGVVPALENGEALLDSGATHSVQCFNVEGVGTVRLKTPHRVITLTNVLYLSINPILAGTQPPPPINLATRPSSINGSIGILWHWQIGHLSLRNLKRLHKYNAVQGLPPVIHDDIPVCHGCSISKSNHHPISTPSCKHIKNPGDLIVAYLMGPLPISHDQMKYVLTIQDFHSRLTAVIPLRDKTKAKSQLINWITRFTTATSFHVKCIRTDNGSEFKNATLYTFLTQHGIAHETSIPYEHHQNGRIECTNQTILEIARTLLILVRIPVALWLFAFKHTAYIFNQMVHFD
ncbi:hypothetical protein O181_071792 [Austropuccinia psidii MF-1]|uniref:Integrase catalytic domain-containing protein n=1 Tax=Austropuccinia psidii MF-1 TaxID=1389203 RepID=A0A9Q3I9I4_9BASI|nr:hypothetical protein [Austropuccinia psidii MF-1]